MRSKALISTELGTGTSFVNINKKTGLVVQPNSSSGLADAINYFIDNQDEVLEMGRLSKERYIRYFTASAMCENYNTVYRRAVKNHCVS